MSTFEPASHAAELGEEGPRDREQELRVRLGIPPSASQVLIFGETSHWDPNWLYSSEEYYERRIQPILDEVLDALERDPRRVFSVESLFFVKLYWERRPEQRDAFRRLVNEGRLKLTGSGITTPDTLLPDTEAILRDYLAGQEWLREEGMTVEPRLAYLPDDFGYSPQLPSLLRALGYDRAGITRIDGMYFIGCDYRRRSAFPLRGSSAEQLEREQRTLDFIWRASDGSEVLCHWNAFSYFQGDMLAHLGVIRWMGTVFGISLRSEGHVGRQVRKFARQLAPLSRTPYLFCPIGCDFNGPIRDLTAILDRFNARGDEGGLFAVAAGLDDYLDLVAEHRAALPVVALDPNPYWMGFYASRPAAKTLCNRITQKLDAADRLAALEHATVPEGRIGGDELRHARTRRALRETWDDFVVCNHHDFITGTSPDRVWLGEQRGWLERAEARVDAILAEQQACPCLARPSRLKSEPPVWRLGDGVLEVETPHYALRIAEERGGCIVSYCDEGGRELLEEPANDLWAYKDTGGLWRMGHEFRGGAFRRIARASEGRARVSVEERSGLLQVAIESMLDRRPIQRWLWLSTTSPLLRARTSGLVRERRTVTCRFPAVSRSETLAMDVPGGIVERGAYKLYDPTFWAARSFAHHPAQGGGHGLVAFLGGPASAALHAGALEWVALRNATRERAFGFLPVLAHPATGTSPEEQTLDYAVWYSPPGDFRALELPRLARRALGEHPLPVCDALRELQPMAEAVVRVDRREVLVSAVKTASRGAGLVVRLQSHAPRPLTVRLHCTVRPLVAARLCDARERDLGELELVGGNAIVPVDSALTSVRLLFS